MRSSSISAHGARLNGMTRELHHGRWNLSDLNNVETNNGKTVFSCFHCGGGSTMGYKLAGFDVLGGVEIDPKMMAVYRANHNPKHSYLMGIEEFNNIPDADLPEELFNLDVLDGSPPCSSFSFSGNRDKSWGKEKKFREGQQKQVLDDLFFHFLNTVEKLQPKVMVAENVKGLRCGKARGYIKAIWGRLHDLGYHLQVFDLNAKRMGVPQSRTRLFFVACRDDLNLKALHLTFEEPDITFHDATKHLPLAACAPLSVTMHNAWAWCRAHKEIYPHNYFESKEGGGKQRSFAHAVAISNKPCPTVMAQQTVLHSKEPRFISDQEIVACQTFPEDFNFCKSSVRYICGMSVPPFMMERIAHQVDRQWLSDLSGGE